MIILRQKEFSLASEENAKLYDIPNNLKELPDIVQKYYKFGINKDFLQLAIIQNTLNDGLQVGPVPCVDEFERDNYKSLFADNQDRYDLGKPTVWYDNSSKKLWKTKSGFLGFSLKFEEMTNKEFKNYLKKSIEEDAIEETWIEDKNYSKIKNLEKSILSKIDKL